MSHQSQSDRHPYNTVNTGAAGGVSPRDPSTRSNLNAIAARLDSLVSHLRDLRDRGWGNSPERGTAQIGKPPSEDTFPSLIAHIENNLNEASDLVEFISTRI